MSGLALHLEPFGLHEQARGLGDFAGLVEGVRQGGKAGQPLAPLTTSVREIERLPGHSDRLRDVTERRATPAEPITQDRSAGDRAATGWVHAVHLQAAQILRALLRGEVVKIDGEQARRVVGDVDADARGRDHQATVLRVEFLQERLQGLVVHGAAGVLQRLHAIQQRQRKRSATARTLLQMDSVDAMPNQERIPAKNGPEEVWRPAVVEDSLAAQAGRQRLGDVFAARTMLSGEGEGDPESARSGGGHFRDS